jgi:hypothetical protein
VGGAVDCVGCAVKGHRGIGSAEIGIEIVVFVIGDDAGSEVFGGAAVSPIHGVGTGPRQRKEVGFRVDCVKAHEFGFAGTDGGEGKPGRVADPWRGDEIRGRSCEGATFQTSVVKAGACRVVADGH